MGRADVDFVLGTQYGDEGKGAVAKIMADLAETDHRDYEWTGRVGAQNAEHRFIRKACPMTARIFPSASADRENIITILGAGHCFMPEQFLPESVALSVNLKNVKIDPHAMWLRPSHAVKGLEAGNARATTGWGVGAAVAEKVARKPGTKLIGDCPEMAEYLCDVPMYLANRGPGLMEGSQGALLSLDHGNYPYCTSKNVTVPSMCAEMGLGYNRVRKVFGVARLVPMRVPGSSGPADGKELSYDEIEKVSGVRIPNHIRVQGDASRWNPGTGEERLFEFSMNELKKSHILNVYNGLALTFADYHREGNFRAKRYDDLHKESRDLIERISREIAPVFLVRTGPGENDNIWLMDPWKL